MSAKINENYFLLQNSYLFIEITRRFEKFHQEHPEKDIIRMGLLEM